MVICYYSNDTYASVTGVSLYSLLENNQDAENITVYIIDDTISGLNKSKMKSLARRYGRELFFIGMPDIDAIFGEFQARYKTTKVIYVKLILYRLLPDSVDKVIFLDSDTLILQSLSGLYSLDMGDMCLAGVNHTSKANLFQLSGLPSHDYVPDSFINGGLYMQNLCMLRDPNIEKRIVDAVRSRKNEHLFNDEAILEYVLRNKIIRLSPIYNAFECFTRGLHKKSIYCCIQKHIQDIAPLVEWKEAYYHPAVVHFPGSDIFRPFITGLCPHPYQKKYRHYKAASPWSDVRLLSGSVPSWERIFVFLLYKTIPYLAYLARLKAYYYQK